MLLHPADDRKDVAGVGISSRSEYAHETLGRRAGGDVTPVGSFVQVDVVGLRKGRDHRWGKASDQQADSTRRQLGDEYAFDVTHDGRNMPKPQVNGSQATKTVDQPSTAACAPSHA